MTYLLIIALIIIVCLMLLFIPKPFLNQQDNIEKHALIREVIANESDEYQIYQEIQSLKNQQSKTHKFNSYFLLLVPLLIAASVYFWYQHQGRRTLMMADLSQQWQMDIKDYLSNKAVDLSKLKDPTSFTLSEADKQFLFCQLISEQINKNNPKQLINLGTCYIQISRIDISEKVFEHLYALEPNNSQAIIALAMIKISLYPEKSLPTALSQQILALHVKQPDNAVLNKISIFINHSSHDYIDNNLYNIDITIPESILSNLTDHSRLFIYASLPNQTQPIAVTSADLNGHSTVQLGDANSMLGEKLSNYPEVIISAKITADNTATGKTLAFAQQLVKKENAKTKLFLTLKAYE